MNDSTNVRIIADNIRKLEKMAKDAESKIPTPAAGDTGKIIKVGSSGYELADEYSYTPPAYSSTDEVNTGRKWIDGRDVYEKILVGTFPEITSASTEVLGTIVENATMVFASSVTIRTNGNHVDMAYFITYNPLTGQITIPNVATTYSYARFLAIIRYCKPAPVPSNETKKKTTKKG